MAFAGAPASQEMRVECVAKYVEPTHRLKPRSLLRRLEEAPQKEAGRQMGVIAKQHVIAPQSGGDHQRSEEGVRERDDT
jgi:hypothetical protein